MMVLRATKEQAKAIESQTKAPHLIKFILDNNNNLIVGKEILSDLKFKNIKELKNLEEIEYISQIKSD